ncbi:hypothetical protein LPJ56_006075 [Coemansia sp. RSA 2599]|nr:hypothetical protein LPJ56_006075 [Coemansia sp. RSA 2599]
MNLHSDPSKHYSRMEKSMFNRIPKDTAGDRANNGHGNGDDDRYSDMRNLGHESDTSNAEMIVEMSPGYLNSSDLPHSPRGNIIGGSNNDGSNMRHFDSQSVDSMDTIDNSVAKTRRIL